MPETGQWYRGDTTRTESVERVNNEDPGVNSDDEDDVQQVTLNVRVTPTSYISIVAD